MTATVAEPETSRRSSGVVFLALGLLLPVLGIAGYAAQLSQQHLTTPWYMPIAATLGAVLVAVSMWKSPGILRGIALLLVVVIASGEWALLMKLRLPQYKGPIAAGKPFPAFTTMRADGSSFTQRDLEGPKDHVLVFFRGRW
jgi:hypothetical protein